MGQLVNVYGRGGEVASVAPELSTGALRAAEGVLNGRRTLKPLDRVEAARLLLRDKSGTVTRERKVAALHGLAELMADPASPDGAVLAAAALVLETTGRQSFQPDKGAATS